MATVSVREQDSVKCLILWTIFQTDDGITLSELFERIKAGRVVFIVPSQDLVNSRHREDIHWEIEGNLDCNRPFHSS